MKVKALLLFLIALPLVIISRQNQIDDSYIYARYVANALSGQGLVFNAGEHVNALTSPLFAYLLLLVSWLLKGKVLLAQAVLSCLGIFGTAYLAERKFSYAGFVLATTAYFYSFVGMETAWFTFFIMASITLYLEGRYNWLPLVLVLLCLTRFEGGAMLIAVAWAMYRERKIPKLVAYVPAVIVALLYVVLNHHFYGAFLPSSTLAKIEQGFSGDFGKWPLAFLHGSNALDLFSYGAIFLCFFAVGATYLKDLNKIVFPFVSILAIFYIGFNVPGYPWYFAPFILLFFIYATVAVTNIKAIQPWMVAVCIVLQFIGSGLWLQHNKGTTPQYVAVSQWIDHNASKDAVIEACETGNIGWYSHRHLIDILGLTTPKNAVHILHRDWASWLKEDNPDYIVIHNPVWGWERVALDSHLYSVAFSTSNIEVLKRKY